MLKSLWEKIKKACGHSLTIAWGYIQLAVAGVLQALDVVVAFVNDPDFKGILQTAINDTQTVARILLATGLLTIAARMRSLWGALRKGDDK